MQQYGPFLVIVPLSTITAWQTQFAAWAPDINVITYIGNAPAREIIRTYEFGASNKKLKMNVLLTTYELTLRDAKELGEIKWQSLAVDEVCPVLDIHCSSFLMIWYTGTSFKEFGEPAIRSLTIIPFRFKVAHHRNSSPK